jgi:hypothetical protein
MQRCSSGSGNVMGRAAWRVASASSAAAAVAACWRRGVMVLAALRIGRGGLIRDNDVRLLFLLWHNGLSFSVVLLKIHLAGSALRGLPAAQRSLRIRKDSDADDDDLDSSADGCRRLLDP